MKKNLIVLTGAGMSAESGISTFRDSGGLWEKYKIEEVATLKAWQANPELVLDFYNQKRKQLFDAEPNKGHYLLAALENHFKVRIITQNVDDLHERAGSSSVLHLHGELKKVRSTGPGEEVFELKKGNPDIYFGQKCPKGYQLRPHIVWFGEAVPEIENAVNIASHADVFIIIGTSLQVYPAAGLLHYVPHHSPVYLIDPHEIDNLPDFVNVIRKKASEGIGILRQMLVG
jgi:NAD-dependent deacetylase